MMVGRRRNYFIQPTNGAVTASTTQTQGQEPLQYGYNDITVVANTNDTVTLPSAAAGRSVWITNNGANTLQIFPASGDDLGQGDDTATTLASTSNIEFRCITAPDWEIA